MLDLSVFWENHIMGLLGGLGRGHRFYGRSATDSFPTAFGAKVNTLGAALCMHRTEYPSVRTLVFWFWAGN